MSSLHRCSEDDAIRMGVRIEVRIAERELQALWEQHCRIQSDIAALLSEVDRTQCFRDDGHRSVKGMVLATLDCAEDTARRMVRHAKLLASFPKLAEAFESGRIHADHVEALSRTYANRRVRDAMGDAIQDLLDDAVRCPMDVFGSRLKSWERLVDQDGSFRADQGVQAGRSAWIGQVGDEVVVRANGSALEGSFLAEVLNAFKAAEFEADVRAGGPNGILARSDAQRSFDALLAIFKAAVDDGPKAAGPINVNVVVDQQTFEDAARRAAGVEVAPRASGSYREYRCHTADGTPVSPDEVFAASLVGTIRRVVLDSSSVVLDLGRKRRFIGSARQALLLQHQRCVFAGCTVSASFGQGDHTVEHSRGGATNPGNGDILCGHHNRFKNHGYSVRRGPDGHWHTYRPDGTELGNPDPPPG